MKINKYILLFLITFIFPLTLMAQSETYSGPQILAANQNLDAINKIFTANDSNIKELKTSISTLEKMQTDANKCIDQSNDQVVILDDLLKSSGIDLKTATEDTSSITEQSDAKYLQDKKSLYVKQASECRLLKFRVREALFEHKSKLQSLSASRLLSVSVPVWELHSYLIMSDQDREKLSHFWHFIGFHDISLVELIFLILAFPVSAYVAVSLQHVVKNYLSRHPEKNHFHMVMNGHILSYIAPLSVSGIVSLVLMIAFYDVSPVPLLLIVTALTFFYYLSMSVIKIYFSLLQLKKTREVLSDSLIHSVYHRLSLFIFVVVLSGFCFLLLSKIYLGLDIIKPLRGIFGYVLAVLLVWTAWPLCTMLSILRNAPFLSKLLKILFSSISALVFVLVTFGYYRLSTFIIIDLIVTFVATLLLVLALSSIQHAYHYLESSDKPTLNILRKFIGVQHGEGIFEMQMFKIIIMFMAVFFFVYFMLMLWGSSENITDEMLIGFAQGFHIAGIRITPLQLIVASIVFGVLNIINRAITTYITSRHQRGAEKLSQVALATVFYYSGFGISLLIGLLVSGFDFTGVAIIAGALSIGVGLGLQAIVNNFVSGLILLIEKPIKAGDRILVGTREGFVKKISIRSTRITTPQREDVIIPNAELISGQVVNYMFRDKTFRISTSVGVAYNSDVELVKETLLNVTKQHPEVIQDIPNQPNAFFSVFADSTINFQLTCLIKDVNQKTQVLSDLNCAIHKAFTEKGISMAFPQRDVHIMNWKAMPGCKDDTSEKE